MDYEQRKQELFRDAASIVLRNGYTASTKISFEGKSGVWHVFDLIFYTGFDIEGKDKSVLDIHSGKEVSDMSVMSLYAKLFDVQQAGNRGKIRNSYIIGEGFSGQSRELASKYQKDLKDITIDLMTPAEFDKRLSQPL